MTFYDIAYSKLINSLKKTNQKILEIGCSHGHLLNLLEEKHQTYGIDISKYAILAASKNTKKTKLKVLDFTKNKSLFETKFNLIIAIDVFEHFKEPEEMIKKCWDMLFNQGYLIIKIPNKNSFILKILKVIGKEEVWDCYKDPTHYSVLELDNWVNLFNKNKFKVKIIASPPTNLLKKLMKNYPLFFFSKFNPKIFNETITITAQKYEN
ncbi:class I SAM-dependent methyltransferase [Candidatus Woesearchaeota archaeon]|nr:class I SAM-dependent methyltransferase [Candidatus Woesearchaeota archaeon]